MDTENVEQPSNAEAASEVAEVTEPKPPWGSDEEFDPKRAWALIQNLRAERDDVKTRHGDAAAKLKEFEDAKLSAEEKTSRDLKDAQQQMSSLQAENALLKAGVEHGLSGDDLQLLAGLPADVIEERAAILAERLNTVPGAVSDLSDRPKPALRGGSTPGEEPEKTPEQIVAELYGG